MSIRPIDLSLAGRPRPVQRVATEKATVRIGTVLAVPDVLRRLGADPAQVLAELGLEPALFDSPDNRMSQLARSRLLGHCAARTGCPHFGLLVGQQAGLHSLGLVGLLAKYSPDVAAAVRSLARFLYLHSRGAGLELAVDGEQTVITLGLPHLEAAEQLGDGGLALLLNVMRSLCGRSWAPDEAFFAHRRPGDIDPFRRFFDAPLRFDAEKYGLVFATHWLGRPLPDVDPELRRLLQQQIDALEARHRDDFPAQVRSVLQSALMTGDAGADSIAALFSMHSRTLHRHLAGFGTSFRELVDDSRFEIARQMLGDSSLEVRRVADMLGYADASAFTRAFRRWSGTTPARWRLQHIGHRRRPR
jgi:AraC-like DNA-binding protein